MGCDLYTTSLWSAKQLMAAVTAAILVKSVIIWSVSDRDDRDTPADCRRCAWLAAHAAAGYSAPSSVQPQVLQDLG